MQYHRTVTFDSILGGGERSLYPVAAWWPIADGGACPRVLQPKMFWATLACGKRLRVCRRTRSYKGFVGSLLYTVLGCNLRITIVSQLDRILFCCTLPLHETGPAVSYSMSAAAFVPPELYVLPGTPEKFERSS